MDTVALWFSSSEDEEAAQILYARKIKRRKLRSQSNILELPEKLFIDNFGLSKDAFQYVLNEITPELKIPKRSTAIPNITKLATTLRFLVKGGYQQGTGVEVALSQPAVSARITEVFDAMKKKLCPKMINFFTNEEKTKGKEYFYKKSGFPGIIGVIDGIHIQIRRPPTDDELFLNSKSKFSINAMVICDYNLRIRAANSRYGGSFRDSYIWDQSDERKHLEASYNNGDKSTWLIGDSKYPLEPWLMTPYQNSPDGSTEAKFNTILSKQKNSIEKVFRILKSRFRCLSAATELHYSPEKTIKMFYVCCALYNVCIEFKVPIGKTDKQIGEENPTNFDETLPVATTAMTLAAIKIREDIKNTLR